MKFQHSTPMPAGVSMMQSTANIGVPQMATVAGNSGQTLTVIPGDIPDNLSVNLIQLLVTWGAVTALGKFVISSQDPDPLTIFQDREAGTIVLPCWGILRLLGNHGLTVQNNSTGGEYSIIANYTVKEI